jgi:hypothetical protein
VSATEPDAHLCLFNTEAYHGLNLGPGHAYVRLDHSEDGRLVGTLAGVLEGDTLECGWRAPFGGLDLVDADERAGAVVEMVRSLCERARQSGARRLRVKCRPAYASRQEAVIQFALLAQGFAVESAELSLGINLSADASTEDYLAGFGGEARRKLRRALAKNLDWREAESDQDWAQAWTIFEATKARHGARMRFGLAHLRALAARFPAAVRVSVLRSGEEAVAAAAVYTVLPGLDYLAVLGQTEASLKDSPMFLVARRMVEDALGHGSHVIDLGLASTDQAPDDGLIRFKRKIGGEPALRLDLVREL